MHNIDACETAYKNGYEKAKEEYRPTAKTFKSAIKKMLVKTSTGTDEFYKIINGLKNGKDYLG